MKHVHFIGICGISQSALAILCKQKGYKVTGSDACLGGEVAERLSRCGITLCLGHKASNIVGADLIVATAAISKDNPELVAARLAGIKIISRAKMLGDISKGYKKVISVAGAHGKTTTTGMIATIFLLAGKNPTVHIGGQLPLIGGNIHIGGNEYFITEACEYHDSFLQLKSHASVILNIQKDHMDYFKTMANLKKSFKKFANLTSPCGYVVTNTDDPNCCKLGSKNLTISYSAAGKQAILTAANIAHDQDNHYYYDLVVCGLNCGRVSLSVPGLHNVSNSLAAAAVALKEGISPAVIIMALNKYTSSLRRYQFVANFCGAQVIHDYAHHPTEIAATINASNGGETIGHKLHIVFEPHTYSRTQYLFKEFLTCFKGADTIILPPIYPAREQPIPGVTSEHLAEALQTKGYNAIAVDSLQEAYVKLKDIVCPGDKVLLLGAGTIENMCKMFAPQQ